jgi:hypothetical protein
MNRRQPDRRAEGIRRSNLKQPNQSFCLVEVGRRGDGEVAAAPYRWAWSRVDQGHPLNLLRAHGVGGCGVMSPGAGSACVALVGGRGSFRRQLGGRPFCKLKVRIYLLEGIKTSSIDNKTTRPQVKTESH